MSARIYPSVHGLFYSPLVENEVLPVFVIFNYASLSLHILNYSPSKYLIPSVRVAVMLIFSKYVTNLSISLDKPTEICWNILSTKMKIFCSEQHQITCELTVNYFQQDCPKQEKHTLKTVFISYPTRKNWYHLNGGGKIHQKINFTMENQSVYKITTMLYANLTFSLHWNHVIISRCPCHFWTICKRPWTIAVEDRHGRLRNMVNL